MKGGAGFAYQAVYRYVLELIASHRHEQRLPSLRQLAQRLGVSVSTTKYAYALLEDEGRILSRPRLGYFSRPAPLPATGAAPASLLDRVYASARQPGMLALSSDSPAMLLSLENPLLMTERELTRQYPRPPAPLYQPFGEAQLRAVVAAQYTRSPDQAWQTEQVYVGADLHSVLQIALAALAAKGRVALVESPCSWAVLRQLHSAGVEVVELPLGDDGRVDLMQVEHLLQRRSVALAVFSSTFASPHASLMPAADKQQLCAWLSARGIWLLENDSYGQLYFGPQPARFRDFADPERLMVFSALDKTIGAEAPFGYLLSRQLAPALQRECLARAFRLPPMRQKAIARLLGSRRMGAHLAALRGQLQGRAAHLAQMLSQHTGERLHWYAPAGGATLWARARRPVDMARVFERLLAQRIVIAPGAVFSQAGHWRHHLRLSFTLDWQQDIATALQHLAHALDQEALN